MIQICCSTPRLYLRFTYSEICVSLFTASFQQIAFRKVLTYFYICITSCLQHAAKSILVHLVFCERSFWGMFFTEVRTCNQAKQKMGRGVFPFSIIESFSGKYRILGSNMEPCLLEVLLQKNDPFWWMKNSSLDTHVVRKVSITMRWVVRQASTVRCQNINKWIRVSSLGQWLYPRVIFQGSGGCCGTWSGPLRLLLRHQHMITVSHCHSLLPWASAAKPKQATHLQRRAALASTCIDCGPRLHLLPALLA